MITLNIAEDWSIAAKGKTLGSFSSWLLTGQKELDSLATKTLAIAIGDTKVKVLPCMFDGFKMPENNILLI